MNDHFFGPLNCICNGNLMANPLFSNWKKKNSTQQDGSGTVRNYDFPKKISIACSKTKFNDMSFGIFVPNNSLMIWKFYFMFLFMIFAYLQYAFSLSNCVMVLSVSLFDSTKKKKLFFFLFNFICNVSQSKMHSCLAVHVIIAEYEYTLCGIRKGITK